MSRDKVIYEDHLIYFKNAMEEYFKELDSGEKIAIIDSKTKEKPIHKMELILEKIKFIFDHFGIENDKKDFNKDRVLRDIKQIAKPVELAEKKDFKAGLAKNHGFVKEDIEFLSRMYEFREILRLKIKKVENDPEVKKALTNIQSNITRVVSFFVHEVH